jgi:hypothetical protein
MRFGGGDFTFTQGSETRTTRSAYIVMDVTNPETPPRLLAEISHPDLGHLRERAIKVVIHRWLPSDAIQNAVRAADAELVVLDAADPGVVVDRSLARDGLQQVLKSNLERVAAAFAKP